MKLTTEDKTSIVSQKKGGASVRELAELFSVTRPAIRRVLRPYGLVRPVSVYGLDRSFFSQIHDERRAYWLGFLLADGNIARPPSGGSTLRVRLQERDLPHLEKMASVFGYGGPVVVSRRFDKYYGRTTAKAEISLCSNQICADLDRHGFTAMKRDGSVAVLDNTLEHLKPHLVRGLIDGDGSISFQRKSHKDYSVSFCDTHEPVVKWVVSYLSMSVSTNSMKTLQSVGTGCWVVIYGCNGQVRRILDHLYGCCSPDSVLDRKYSRYLQLKGDLDARAL